MSAVSFHASREDHQLIGKIADRFISIASGNEPEKTDRLSLVMDLTACHANGCKLRLTDLLDADTTNFLHDVCGIRRHIDRETGELMDCFRPRFAAKGA